MVRLHLEFRYSTGGDVIRGDLETVLGSARAVLFDFDGPVCSVFSGVPAPSVARDLRDCLETRTGERVAINATDPMEVLRLSPSIGPGAVEVADDLLTEAESTAVVVASPTPGGESSLQACVDTGRRAAIVSNNSATAVRRYLAMHDLEGLKMPIVGRKYGKPHRMKPDPAPVRAALQLLDVGPDVTVLVGDSVTDILAAHAVGVQCIAYANKPGKVELFADADVVIDDMRILAEYLARVPVVGR